MQRACARASKPDAKPKRRDTRGRAAMRAGYTSPMTEFIPSGTRGFDLPSPFPIKRGGARQGARLAYETWGTLDAQRGNAILIVTGLTYFPALALGPLAEGLA